MAERRTYCRMTHRVLSVFMNSLVFLNKVLWVKNVLNICILRWLRIFNVVLWKRFILLIVDSCDFVRLLFLVWSFLFFVTLNSFILVIELRNKSKYFKNFVPHLIIFESKTWFGWFNICKLKNKCWNVWIKKKNTFETIQKISLILSIVNVVHDFWKHWWFDFPHLRCAVLFTKTFIEPSETFSESWIEMILKVIVSSK